MGCGEMTDFIMSEKFGLGWKDGESRRMAGFIVALNEAGKQHNSGGDGRDTFR